jgi:septal ring factor EnvC (AmiA/AmiB activator)
MKRTLLAVLTLTATLLLDHGSAFAQDTAPQAGASQSTQSTTDQNIELFRKDIRSQKKQLIALNVPLTDAEAQKFWPVYDQYTAELVQVNNDKYALIKEFAKSYDTMTDAQAQDWTKRMLALDANVAAVRQKYLPNFSQVLTPKKTALYEQVERKVQMLIDTQLALQIPLVQP